MGQLLESLVYRLSDLQSYSFYLNRYRLVKLIHNLFYFGNLLYFDVCPFCSGRSDCLRMDVPSDSEGF
jgi:hypothetical protein